MAAIVKQPPLNLFSTEHMPYACSTQPTAKMEWFGADSEERYKKAPHPAFGTKDILYKFNSYGYRCPEFKLDKSGKKTITVVSVGASEVLGTGLPENKTFPHIFIKLLEKNLGCTAINWNLGVGGSSSDYLSRILISALPILKPDIVLLVYPYLGRREHINDDGRIFSYNRQDNDQNNRLRNRILDPERFVLTQANMNLSSEYNDQINFYKNYQICESLCEKYQSMWLFSAYQISYFNQIQHLINSNHLVHPGLGDLKKNYRGDPVNGLARDMGHPGIGPNKEMAGLFFKQLQSLYSARLAFFDTHKN